MSHYSRGKAGFNLGERISRAFIPRPMAIKRRGSSYGGSRKRARTSRFRTRSRSAVSARRTLRNRKRSFRRKRARASKRMSFGPRLTMGNFIKWQKQQVQWHTDHSYNVPNPFQCILNSISVDGTAPADFQPLGTVTNYSITPNGPGGFTQATVTGVNRVWLNRVSVRLRIEVPNGLIPDLGILIQAYRLKKATSVAGTIHQNPWLYNDTFKDYKILRKKVIKLKDTRSTVDEQVVEFIWNFSYKKWIYTINAANATGNPNWNPSIEDADTLQFSIGSNTISASVVPVVCRWSLCRYFAITPFTNQVV